MGRVAQPDFDTDTFQADTGISGLPPLSPVVNGGSAAHHTDFQTVVMKPVDIVVILSILVEHRGESSNLDQSITVYQPMRRHHERYLNNGAASRILNKCPAFLPEIGIRISVRVPLYRAEYPETGLPGILQFPDGIRFYPGILIQQIDISVTIVQCHLEAYVVRLAESEILSGTNDFHLRERAADVFNATV